MVINASKKKRAHWQSKSIRGNRTWKRDSNSRHFPLRERRAAEAEASKYGAEFRSQAAELQGKLNEAVRAAAAEK